MIECSERTLEHRHGLDLSANASVGRSQTKLRRDDVERGRTNHPVQNLLSCSPGLVRCESGARVAQKVAVLASE